MVVAQQGNQQMSPSAAAVARVACAQGMTATEVRTDVALRARLTVSAGESFLDEGEWQQVQAAIIAAMRSAARAHGSAAGECRSCGQPVRWVETTQGKKMPLDPLPCPTLGNVEVRPSGSQMLAFVYSPSMVPLSVSRPVFRAHAATCPNVKRRQPDQRAGQVKKLTRRCRVCGHPMDQKLWSLGERTHPTCGDGRG